MSPDWAHNLTGFAAHWNKNTNLAWAFDTWFMNLFPREHPFTNNGGGYSTLSFIPTLGTMILGLIAGGVLRSERTPMAKIRWLAIAGIVGLGAGLLLGTWASARSSSASGRPPGCSSVAAGVSCCWRVST